jgi:hypothetical protein
MHTSSVSVGTNPVDQFPAVVHWLSPAAPVHVLVHVTAAAAAVAPSGEDGKVSSGTTRAPAVRRTSHEDAFLLPLSRRPILNKVVSIEGSCHPFRPLRLVHRQTLNYLERDAGLIGPSAMPK